MFLTTIGQKLASAILSAIDRALFVAGVVFVVVFADVDLYVL